MKKFLMLLLVGLLATVATDTQAQVAWRATGVDTLSGADTGSLVTEAIPDGFSVRVQASIQRLTGTLAGKIYLRETLNGTDYVTIDSLTLTNVPRASRVFSISGTPAVRYELQFVTSGSVTARYFAHMIRRRE